MYAGTTIRHGSGKFVGVHQKIDRSARRHLKTFLPKSIEFPSIKEILYFEGNNGPDGIKRKNPAQEPWYYINPEDPDDRKLLDTIDDHLANLIESLKNSDRIRASFDAAWLAHAIVDGLTPAHHYPLGDKIEELWGKTADKRESLFEKNVVIGDGVRDTLQKNWEYWGAGGVLTTHAIFEFGVASCISTTSFRDMHISRSDITELKKVGFEKMFLDSLNKVNSYKMYEELGKNGWTQKLAKQIRDILAPEMIKMIVLAWYQAATQSVKD